MEGGGCRASFWRMTRILGPHLTFYLLRFSNILPIIICFRYRHFSFLSPLRRVASDECVFVRNASAPLSSYGTAALRLETILQAANDKQNQRIVYSKSIHFISLSSYHSIPAALHHQHPPSHACAQLPRAATHHFSRTPKNTRRNKPDHATRPLPAHTFTRVNHPPPRRPAPSRPLPPPTRWPASTSTPTFE